MVKFSKLIATVAIITSAILSGCMYKTYNSNIVVNKSNSVTLLDGSNYISALNSNVLKVQYVPDVPVELETITEADPIVEPTQDQKNEHLCLAKNIFYEASNEPTDGKIAVAQITIQRASNPKYPSSICDVVYQKYKTQCQFSWHCDKKLQKIKPTNGPLWEESKLIASQVLFDGLRLPHLEDALFFKAIYVPTAGFWARLKPVARIGLHVFYKW